MAFKNEVVSDADIDRYNLPFQKGDGRWWTRDAERDYYLWGGLSGNPAYGTEQVGKFYLYFDGRIHLIVIALDKLLTGVSHSSYSRYWRAVERIVPDPIDLSHEASLLDVLKEALQVYGFDGQDDGFAKDKNIRFGF